MFSPRLQRPGHEAHHSRPSNLQALKIQRSTYLLQRLPSKKSVSLSRVWTVRLLQVCMFNVSTCAVPDLSWGSSSSLCHVVCHTNMSIRGYNWQHMFYFHDHSSQLNTTNKEKMDRHTVNTGLTQKKILWECGKIENLWCAAVDTACHHIQCLVRLGLCWRVTQL